MASDQERSLEKGALRANVASCEYSHWNSKSPGIEKLENGLRNDRPFWREL